MIPTRNGTAGCGSNEQEIPALRRFCLSQKGKERLEMVTIKATCVDCGRVFSYSCICKPKKPMKRCPNCAWKNYAGKYIAKHRVDKSTGIYF